MIRKLKRSFVTITMISAALVLVILMGIVNLTTYLSRTSSDIEILMYLAENGGRFPQDGKNVPSVDMSPFGSDEMRVEEPGGRVGRDGRRITNETLYETRYYSVFIPADGSYPFADTSQIAALTAEEAVSVAQSLPQTDGKAVRYGNYRYMTVAGGAGVLYVFLDCNRNITAVRSFLINSIIVTAAGLVVLYILAVLLSGRAIRPIAESYEKQKSFITNAGHELKTPLAVIESSTEVIEIENGESQWTRSIRGQVERLAALTQELVELSRMDEGRELALEELDATEVVAGAIEPFALLAEQKGLAFAAELEPGIRLRSDRGSLEKICGILADNAVKYASDGGSIRITLRREGGRAVLRCENPAEGLSPGKQEKLFDRFYRGDASHSSEQPGYGLGLSLARTLAEALGGRITAESPDGKRLIMTVTFY